MTEITPAELQDLKDDSELGKKIVDTALDNDLNIIDLTPEEKFIAFKSWVAGIAEAGKDAFHLQTDLEKALPREIPIARFLMKFLARIDSDFLLQQLDFIDRASWHEGIRHDAFLIANLLPILDVLAFDAQKDQEDEVLEDDVDVSEDDELVSRGQTIPNMNEILDLIFDLQPPLALFMETDSYLQFLLHPQALPIIERGIEKTGLFPGLPEREAARQFVQEITSHKQFHSIPLVASEFAFLEAVERRMGIVLEPLPEEQIIPFCGFVARYGHVIKLILICKELEYFNIIQAGLRNPLPDSLGELRSLQVLRISYYPTSILPASIGTLTSLRVLDLAYLPFISIPESIGNLRSLQTLSIYKTNLDSLPSTLTNLPILRSLSLEWNKLKELPPSLIQLRSLRTLSFKQEITEFPPIICQLTSLENLDVMGFNLTSIPDQICNLQALHRLILRYNKLEYLPPSLLQCKSLEILELRSNMLTTVPDWFGDFPSLKELELSANQLSTLPANIGKLKFLETLDLVENRITSLPIEITQLLSLRQLYIEDKTLGILSKDIQGWIRDKKVRTHNWG